MRSVSDDQRIRNFMVLNNYKLRVNNDRDVVNFNGEHIEEEGEIEIQSADLKSFR